MIILRNKKRNVEIIVIGLFVAILGGSLFYDAVQSLIYSIKEPSMKLNLPDILLESIIILFPFSFMVGGISFLFLKKWSIYLVRTGLLLLIAIGILLTVAKLFVGFTGLPPISFYLIMLFEVVTLYLINRPKVKEQFK